MNDKWLTVLPLQNLWGKPAELPATFAAGVSLQEIPPMLVVRDKHDRLRVEFIRRLGHATHAIVVEYTAAAIDNSQQRAVYQAHLALLALWLVRPTPLYAPEAGHFRIEGDQAITREVASLQPFSAHPSSYSRAENEPADFAEAAKLHGYMNNGANEGVVRVAIDVAMGALAQSAQVRLLLMWVAAEALFGADREISFRIAQRIAMFLGISPDNRKEIFKKVKAGYSLRSKVVHGMKIEGTSPEKANAAMADIETVLRKTLVKILSGPGLVKAFNSKKRGDFLDGLAFD